MSYGSKSFFEILKLELFSAKAFFEQLGDKPRFGPVLTFVLTNICFGFLIQILIRMYKTQSFVLFFPAVSEAIFLVFLSFVIMVLFGCVLYVIAKLLGGKGDFKSSLIFTGYSTPVFGLFVPYFFIPVFCFIIYLLISGFFVLHHYSKTKAVINIVIPVMGIVILMFVLGFREFSFLDGF